MRSWKHIHNCFSSVPSAQTVTRWLVLPRLHERAGKWGRDRRAVKRAGRCCKGKKEICVEISLLCLSVCLTDDAVSWQTEGFDGFTLELWSQLGGNKRRRVVFSARLKLCLSHVAIVLPMIQEVIKYVSSVQGAGAFCETCMWDSEG